MRRFILHVVLCLGFAFAPCLNVASAASNGGEASSPLDEQRYQAYVDKLAQAARDDVAHWRPPKDLPPGDSFKEIAAAGAENIDLCIRFLAESAENAGNKDTGRQRMIAIYSMYQLDVDGYVAFMRKLANLYRTGLLHQGVWSRAIYYRYSDLVIEQYRNPKIEALFQEILAQEDIPPDVAADIRYIRSGEGFARKRINDFDRECTNWSMIRSVGSCVSLATQILRVKAAAWITW